MDNIFMWALMILVCYINDTPLWWRHDMETHSGDVIMGTMASEITSLTIVYSTVYSDVDQNKHQSSASLAFVRGIHRGPMNSPHKWPVTRKMFPFDDVIMLATRGRVTVDLKTYAILNFVGTSVPFTFAHDIATPLGSPCRVIWNLEQCLFPVALIKRKVVYGSSIMVACLFKID